MGTTVHPGAVATVPHGCPTTIRAMGTTVHPGAVATVLHGCPTTIRAMGTTGHGREQSLPFGTPDRHAIGRGVRPPNGGITRRCWQTWGVVWLVAHRGSGESHPGWGLRQQRRVHAVLGGAGAGDAMQLGKP
jgi:hypothetical protein